MKEERSNQYCQKTFCKRTYRNYVKSLNLKEHDATSKNTGRISAFTNIRNHLTLCTMLDNLQEFVQGENLHSVDDVSILANPMSRKSKVLLSTEAERFLQEHNLSVAAHETSVKQRVLTFSCTISAIGKLTVTCIKVADRMFSDYSEKHLWDERRRYKLLDLCGGNCS